jgi:outer membrane biosynthesis protein TonB
VLVSLVCFCYYFNLAIAQEYTSPNILDNSPNGWDGQFTVSSANGGDGTWAGLSGGSKPNIGSSTGTIRWGYIEQTLVQSVAVQQALAQQGIIVEGYTYRWTVKNYNANHTNSFQTRKQDPLYVEVAIYDTNNQLVEYKKFDYSYSIPRWTTMGGTEIFTDPYEASKLSNLELSVTGKDEGFWAGYYGPEFRDYSIQFLYSIDACISDPLSSTECPGYAEAYFNQQCLADALYDQKCPGYAQAYFTQQCSLDALYDSKCPGYEQAYAIKLNEEMQQAATNDIVDDGTNIETFNPVVETFQVEVTTQSTMPTEETNVAQQEISIVVEEAVTAVLEEQVPQQQEVQQVESQPQVVEQSTPVETKEETSISEPVEVAVEETKETSPEATSETSTSSNRQIIGRLNSLGILGNSATNGTGDPTGLGRNTLDGVNSTTGGTIASSTSDSSSSNGTSQSSMGQTSQSTSGVDSSSQNGSDSGMSFGTSTSSNISETGMGMSMTQQDMGLGNSNSSFGGATDSGSFQSESNAISDVQQSFEQPIEQASIQVEQMGSGVQDNSGVSGVQNSQEPELSFELAIGDSVFMVTIEVEQSQNPSATGGDPQKDLNSVFGGPESLQDNNQMSAIASQQEETYKTAASRMIEDKIKNISVIIEEPKQQKTNTKEEEEFIASINDEESEEDTSAGALLTKEVSQAEVVAQIATNDEFVQYGNKTISQIDFYSPKVVYQDKLPENQRGLRNGLAQQLLHEKMVQQQYEK